MRAIRNGSTGARGRRAGFTMLEMSIAAAILLLLGGSLITALGGLRSVTTTGSTESKLQESGQRLLRTIIADLRRTGEVGGYPVVFDNANPTAGFEHHAHPATAKSAVPDEPDFGDDRDLIFLLPEDADLDGRPDLAPDGTLVWGAEELSYVAVPAGDGTNQIERRVDAAFQRRLAGNVELLRFDDFASSGGLVPAGCVRVRLSLRDRDDDGVMHRYMAETTIQLRNGG